MRKLIFAVLMFVGCWSFAQEQEELGNYANAASEFMSLYNSGDYEGVFNLFSDDMKKAMPREQTIVFFNQNVQGVMGAITKMEFYELKQGAHVYRTSFERSIADITISLNPQNQINGLFISPPKPLNLSVFERNTTKMIVPFNEESFVFWGGTTVEQNYHVAEISQQFAYDILMVADGVSYKGDASDNQNYYIYGKEVIAVCDARVAKVISGVQDNIPGELNLSQLTGNTVVLKTTNNEFVLYAHLKEGSIVVEEGQDVVQGEVLGLCGNSGNSSEPHLHLSLQNDVEMFNSTGAKLYFDKLMVNGEEKEDYLPVKEDFIKNIN